MKKQVIKIEKLLQKLTRRKLTQGTAIKEKIKYKLIQTNEMYLDVQSSSDGNLYIIAPNVDYRTATNIILGTIYPIIKPITQPLKKEVVKFISRQGNSYVVVYGGEQLSDKIIDALKANIKIINLK